MKLIFNRSKLTIGKTIKAPSDNEIENTPSLRQASFDIAYRYGGTLTRRALEVMDFTFSRKHVIVDTKVHFLMKGWCPSIPGWHTDGVPRGDDLNSAGTGLPNIIAQQTISYRPPIYHLLVCGKSSLTTFIKERNVELTVPNEPTRDLYAKITHHINKAGEKLSHFPIPNCTVVTWDWWELHSAEWATEQGWRYLIRVTETDAFEPRTNLTDILRYQNLVFVKSDEVGW